VGIGRNKTKGYINTKCTQKHGCIFDISEAPGKKKLLCYVNIGIEGCTCGM
jgi:hypothetical protein